MRTRKDDTLFGLLAEFDSAEALLDGTRRTHAEGYREIEAYSSYPIHGLADAAGHTEDNVPWIVLAGGIIGACAGFGLQYWVSVIEYPMIVAGRPFNSWPAFIPVTFETTILFASLAAVFGMLALNGLPRPHHPLFAVDRFEKVTRDGYFLAVHVNDPKFDLDATERFLRSLPTTGVDVVEY